MTDQELCTQYELLAALIESGNTQKTVEILKDAIQRLKGTSTKSGNDKSNNDDK